jgi:hypothetical protein
MLEEEMKLGVVGMFFAPRGYPKLSSSRLDYGLPLHNIPNPLSTAHHPHPRPLSQ